MPSKAALKRGEFGTSPSIESSGVLGSLTTRMEFIQNTRKGSQLDTLSMAATKSAKSVLAAVAYVTDTRSLIDSCWKAQKPLILVARYDYSGPVSAEVLQWFLSMGSQTANYQMRLVADIFHPKVIWWKGVGAYIGSANLTKSAWGGNVEAGVFLSEEELDDNDMRTHLESFFEEIHKLSYPLTKEIAAEMVEAGTGKASAAQEAARKEFERTRKIARQHSLISVTKQPARAKNREAFLREWADTLQHLRDIGHRLTLPENRPSWITTNASPGVLADQFLHAYYYNRVRDGVNYPYRELFKTNSNNREIAIQGAIDWWRQLSAAPSQEDIHITTWAPKVKQLLTSASLRSLTVAQFQELCLKIHAVRDHAKRVSSTTLGLQQGMQQLPQDDRVREFAKWLFVQKSPDGSTTCEVIDFVLHGGGLTEVPDRIFAACIEDEKKIPHMGVSALGEMVGWAMPDDFPPRNGRTSKALTALGFNVTIHSE